MTIEDPMAHQTTDDIEAQFTEEPKRFDQDVAQSARFLYEHLAIINNASNDAAICVASVNANWGVADSSDRS
jgi:hypothetical protein